MRQNKKRPRVAIVYKSLPQYRRRFYELLKMRLELYGIDFVLIYGQPGASEASKRDSIHLPWAEKIENKIYRLGSRELYWQPCLRLLEGTDLVIVEQASKLMLNYLLMLQSLMGMRKIAFWGHGRNFQDHNASWLGEKVKAWMSRHVHWWFSYNELSAEVVKGLGFPAERITAVQNAIDTRQLVQEKDSWTPERLAAFKHAMGIASDNIGLYTGGMYPEKRLPFLLGACERIRKQVPDFQMIFIGAGVEDAVVKEAAARHDWIHYVGPKFETEKVPYFLISKLFLMPGLVGLAILDTFALGVPLVTTHVRYHSPEIEYLRNHENGVMLEQPDDAEAYAAKVIELLTDEQSRKRLQEGCIRAGLTYTIEEMAERFAQGICRAVEEARDNRRAADGGERIWQS